MDRKCQQELLVNLFDGVELTMQIEIVYQFVVSLKDLRDTFTRIGSEMFILRSEYFQPVLPNFLCPFIYSFNCFPYMLCIFTVDNMIVHYGIEGLHQNEL